ncbi:AMP-binding protein [Mycobacterium helveticum]|uniref:AMP-binding protein n=1 Tax=Mycobacterium helveticum TaxID=2592811 RepID=A0A557XCY0_9MYCO|nr:AMP-binding protein [Mycobacterium helveticum]TVS89593.1 AMP-binding protein [Mycobacterium helveticum]
MPEITMKTLPSPLTRPDGGFRRGCTVRIVDPETCAENPAGKVGEIWVHGRNVAGGYWRNPQLTDKTFGGRIADPSPGTPEGPWLRTGDLGVISDDELFIVGRINDLLIVDGRNHYPDDIEATIQEITAGRAAAPGSVDIRSVKQLVRMAVLESHSLRVADVVVVPPGSIPITTSGKIRRSACAQQYLQDKFAGMEIPA